jgi:hypothetical protein
MSISYIYKMNLVLHQQIYVKPSTKLRLKIGPSFIYLRLMRMHVC